MTSSAKTDLHEALSVGQQEALLTLLVDEDPAVYRLVRERILACGLSGLEWLREHRLASDPRLRRRVCEIFSSLGREKADDDFLTFCVTQGEDFDIERAAWLLARTRFPEINVDAYRAVLDAYAETLRERIRGVSPPREVLLTINRFLFETVGLEGNETDYYAPENSYLNLVLDRRTGNPINVCLVYLVIARRLQLPITGIGMPGHFVCRYQSSVEEIYIDAFNAGRLLTKADCVKYLLQSSYGFQEGLLAPASPRRILLRICSNLHQTYLHLKLRDETARIQRYIVALAS